MFVSDGQIYYFFECVLAGIVCGAVYIPFYAIKKLTRNKFVGIFSDVVFAVPFCFIYAYFALEFSFPDFRLYMIFGVICGFLLENESFNKTLAFFALKWYNKFGEKFVLKLRRKHGVRKQIKKARRRGNGNGYNYVIYTDNRDGVSDSRHGKQKKRSRKTASGNSGIAEGNRERRKRKRQMAH